MEVLVTELNKRISTSFILLAIFSFSYFNKYLLFVVLLFCFYQIFYEFFIILRKILAGKYQIYFVLMLLILLILLSYLVIFVWNSLVNGTDLDKIFLLIIILITISSDIGGYIFGKVFKGKKLTSISPNKTISGMLGSYVMSIMVVFFCFKNLIDNSYLLFIIFLVSTISQFGDLFVSYLKRKGNFKDTGEILPGHGGILDRFDGMIFALILGSTLKNLL